MAGTSPAMTSKWYNASGMRSQYPRAIMRGKWIAS